MYSTYSVAAAICSVIFPVLATIAVALRFRARQVIKHRLRVDDYAIVVALVFAIALCLTILHGAFAGSIGRDLKSLMKSPHDFEVYSKHLFVSPICAYLAYGLAKISILEFYKRIFAVSPRLRFPANFMIGIVICWIAAAELTHIFSAWPISQFWTLGGHFRVNFGGQATAFAALDIFLDVVILCMPLPVINTLQMDRAHKIKVAGIFWLGIFCVVAASVRLYFTYELSLSGKNIEISKTEFSYVSVNILIWGEIESCCSIIAACLPTYGPMLKNFKIFKSLARGFTSVISLFNSRRTQASSLGRLRRSAGNGSATAGDSTSASDVQGDWYPLKDANNVTIVPQDVESGLQKHSRDITVGRSFGSTVDIK